ncbi:hypothetical protein EIP91_005635 [Steccherinum ochraceum]|uniref:Uncharacterized protein n=1 Tax=Steccherinum ochraceum TaxID=92696 RepID=A0A4V2MVP3_9APHY|nr:hypothetical protein EIP91_005635 [Steccherinum ochraceum]
MTEATLRYSYSIEHLNTNHEHESAQLTMQMMVNAIKYNQRSVYPLKGLAALCRMVLNPEEYWEKVYDDPEKAKHPGLEALPGHAIALYNARLLQKVFNLPDDENLAFKRGILSNLPEKVDRESEPSLFDAPLAQEIEMVDVSSIRDQMR